MTANYCIYYCFWIPTPVWKPVLSCHRRWGLEEHRRQKISKSVLSQYSMRQTTFVSTNALNFGEGSVRRSTPEILLVHQQNNHVCTTVTYRFTQCGLWASTWIHRMWRCFHPLVNDNTHLHPMFKVNAMKGNTLHVVIIALDQGWWRFMCDNNNVVSLPCLANQRTREGRNIWWFSALL